MAGMAAVGGSSGEGTATTAAPPMASSSTPSLQYVRPGGAWHCRAMQDVQAGAMSVNHWWTDR